MNFSIFLDPLISIPITGLMGISLALIASTSPSLLVSQLLFFFIGLILFFIFASLDVRVWIKLIWILYFLSVLFLILTFFGPVVRGATRWIDILGFRLQPSEFIKPLIIVIFSVLMTQKKSKTISSRIIHLIYLIPLVLLVFKQPDLGNVIVYLFIYLSLLVNEGIPWKILIVSGVLMILLFPVFWHFLQEYQQLRLLSFINPQNDPVGTGYNALQAKIALGSGLLSGLGLGRGTQSKLLFLPEYHTDFVFASLGEEMGFIGGLTVLLLYFFLLWKMIKNAAATEDKFKRAVCIGVFSQFFIQIFINIGMNLGLVPITGITLPLISYGGSSIISTFINLGLVLSVSRLESKKPPLVIG